MNYSGFRESEETLVVRLMTVFRGSIVFGDFGGGYLDVGICSDEGGNVLVGLPLGTEFFDFVADHTYEGLDGEHFGAPGRPHRAELFVRG
jgi:hypothetical protein